jgi:transmembrane sensor
MTNNHVWHLVARKLSGEATLDELRELEQVLRDDPELAYQVELYTSYYDAPQSMTRTVEDETHSWHNTKSNLRTEFPESFSNEEQTPVRRINGKKLLVAASLFVIITAALFFIFNPDTRNEQFAATAVNELKTMPGTRTKLVLPDGTQVWLNSDSYITYNKDFGQSKREITLKGEAYFDVFHNPDVPMVVHARSVNIWVKGTAFNVRNYPESGSVETSLIRGSVELTTDEDPARKILLKPNEKITIEARPDSMVTKQTEQPPVIKPSYYHINPLKESIISKTIPEIAWIENKLVFDNEAFTEVIIKMEKWYNAKFIIDNDELAMKKFSGAFEKETLYEALSALQMINHFEFIINGNEVIIK